ncbi:MAG: mechanosensitive ion channel domain-containing protein [Mariniphaga sp.]
MSVLYEYIKEFFLNYGINNRLAIHGAAITSFFLLVIFSLLIFLIFRKIIVKIVGRIVIKTTGVWDDTLFNHKVFHVLTHIIPALIIYVSSGFAGDDIVQLAPIIKGFAQIYLAIIIMTALTRFLDAAMEIYNIYPYSKDRPIKGYIQLMKIFVYFFGAIFIISVLVDKNPASLFAGLGALAAVLMLVFKDPILGFVASIQLAANNMVKPGDWITVPRFNVDGTVYDISLTTVKVQNWDKTITMIPTYSLVSEPVTNWVGMVESGGRRIQRSVYIDINTIRICDQELMNRIGKLPHFNEFLIQESSNGDDYQDDQNVGGLKMDLFDFPTNLSLFKKYLEGYCCSHPGIHESMTRMVRFLQSNERGLPVEVIVFSKAQQGDLYEALQAEIFDHIFAVLPQFGLRVFQNPSAVYPVPTD